MENILKNLVAIEKIDAHSHVGFDVKNTIPADINRYLNIARLKNICQAILISVPNPRYWTKNGIYTPINYHVEGNNLKIYSELIAKDGSYKIFPANKNPFAESNEILENKSKLIRQMNLSFTIVL